MKQSKQDKISGIQYFLKEYGFEMEEDVINKTHLILQEQYESIVRKSLT